MLASFGAPDTLTGTWAADRTVPAGRHSVANESERRLQEIPTLGRLDYREGLIQTGLQKPHILYG